MNKVRGEMKQIIGIDVSKQKLDLTWLRSEAPLKLKSKVFSNDKAGHKALVQWCLSQTQCEPGQLHVVMEATGIYHEALAYYLNENGVAVSVVNPAKLRGYANSLGARTKTDKKDSVVIARYGASQSPALWQPEAHEIRQLKALLARYNAIDKDVLRESNRLEKAQIAAVSGEVIRSIETILTDLQEEKARLKGLIDDHIDQNPGLKNDRHLLESIPGVGAVISSHMLAVIGSRDFENARQCAAFIGLNPVQHESGSSVRKRSHLAKNGQASIRAKLYMAAVVAIRYNPDIQRLLANGKTRMAALGAAMRKLVHICFGVLKHQKPYLPQAA
jgi:transposase